MNTVAAVTRNLTIDKRLSPDMLRRRCNLKGLDFVTTADLEGLAEVVGHARALEAMKFGIGIRRRGFNLFLLGPAGTGKYTTLRTFLEDKAAHEATPDDWCYVNNFKNPEKPRALCLPPGKAVLLRDDILRLLDDLRSAIPSAFQSENHSARKRLIEQEVKSKQESAFEGLQQEADKKNIAVIRTPTGIALAPTRNGKIVSPEAFEKLPESENKQIQAEIGELQEKLQKALREAPRYEQEGREKIRDLNREVANFAVGHLIDALRKKYMDLKEVVAFVDEARQDVAENVDESLAPPENPFAELIAGSLPVGARSASFVRRYQVNVLVDHTHNCGAPIVYENNPSYQNLVGQVEHMAQMGTLTTDFNLIRAGALHRANGGYLILDPLKLLTQPYAWEALKRSLLSSELRIESLGQMLSLVSTVSLEPQAIPLDLKVILVGDRMLYYLLCSLDSDFNELFKVAADFEEDIDWDPVTEGLYARLIATIARQEYLLPFDCGAVARLIEQSSRMAGNSQKVLNHRRTLIDLLRESDYWAREAARKTVTTEDVQRAIDA